MPREDWKARIAEIVSGPTTPSVEPGSKPRAVRRVCISIFSVRLSSRSPRGHVCTKAPPPAIRSPRWPMPIA
jgi:hypothetical protein